MQTDNIQNFQCLTKITIFPIFFRRKTGYERGVSLQFKTVFRKSSFRCVGLGKSSIAAAIQPRLKICENIDWQATPFSIHKLKLIRLYS